MEYKDYYTVLGVQKTATADEIKKAYRKLARKYHPDISKEANAEEKMKEINEANAVLSDKERRAAYDQLGSQYKNGQEFRPPPDWNAGFEYSGSGMPGSDSAEFSDFFADLFGQARHARNADGYKARGEDHHAKVFVDLLDAFNGTTKGISLKSPYQDAQGHVYLKERVLNVKIPKGVKEGQHLRLPGQGDPGYGGGASGDLYLEIHFKPDLVYSVQGRDLYKKTPITPWEAALGSTIIVSTPKGDVKVKVPENAKTGNKLRLRGSGIPAKDATGDLYLIIEIVTPPANSEKARQFYQKMADEFSFNPRENVKG
jgi:curved DNA-binding protein